MINDDYHDDPAALIAAIIDGDFEPAGPEAFASAPHPIFTGFPAGWEQGEDVVPADDERPADADTISRDVLAACSHEPQNDTGNGARLLKHFGADLLHVRNVGWHAWAGTHWEGQGGAEIATRFAQTTAARIVLEVDMMSATANEQHAIDAAVEARAAIAAIDKGESTPASRARRQRLVQVVEAGDAAAGAVQARQIARRKYSVSSGNAGKIRGMLEQALPHRTVTIDELDADKMALNVENGTIRFVCDEVPDPNAPDHLQKMIKRFRVEVQPHERADRMTRFIPVQYDPKAQCPTFMRDVKRFLPIDAVRGFVQRYHGYALTGLTGEQCLIFNYGTGSNWKSTFVEIVARIMGPYCATIAFESLAGDQQRSGSQATPDLARLPGARLVRASEPERGVQFKEALLKSLTGGEPMLVRSLNKEFFEFRPDFKIVLSGNHKPEIGGVDHGIWRRIRFVLWPETIKDHERRPMDEIMAELWAERSGILNWLIAGALDYLNNGLQTPQEVIDSTAEYREEMDPVGSFVESCVERVPAAPTGALPVFVTARNMYDAFASWAVANAVRPWREKSFATAMSQKGFLKMRHKTGVRYLNVVLKDVPISSRRRDDEPPHTVESDVVPI